MKLENYLKDPCGQSSLPYHKLKTFKLPDHLKVLHERDYDGQSESQGFFRCIHHLKDLKPVTIKDGYKLEIMNIKKTSVQNDLSEFIKKCYLDERLSTTEIQSMINSGRFDKSLWLKITDKEGDLLATAVSEIDFQVGEGMLEWIQVLGKFQGQGLGKAIVQASLNNFKGKVDFVTVSGRIDNETNPQRLYKSCGFTGDDVWHVIKK